jgi:hypothetical protein
VKLTFQPVAVDPFPGTLPSESIGPENVMFLDVAAIEPPPPIAVGFATGHWTVAVFGPDETVAA